MNTEALSLAIDVFLGQVVVFVADVEEVARRFTRLERSFENHNSEHGVSRASANPTLKDLQ